jgi:PAS domain S-box-containing protein
VNDKMSSHEKPRPVIRGNGDDGSVLADTAELLRTAIGAAGIGTWIYNPETGRCDWCESSLGILGLPSNTVIDYESVRALAHPEDKKKFDQAFARYSENSIPDNIKIEFRIVRHDTEVLWVAITGQTFLVHVDGKAEPQLRMAGTVMDVSDRKRYEEELRWLSRNLEKEVAERSALAEQRAEQLRKFALALSRAEQQLRRHFADVVHNDLQQMIVAALLRMRRLCREINSQPAAGMLESAIDLLRKSVEEARRISIDLSPPILAQAQLDIAIRWLGGWIRDMHDFAVDFECEEEIVVKSDQLRMFLFDSIKELLFNAVKHSGVERALVSLHKDEAGFVVIRVSDRGVGVDMDKLRKNQEAGKGFGIFSIRERIEVFGGSVRFDSAVGMGFRIEITVPSEVKDPMPEPVTALRREAMHTIMPRQQDRGDRRKLRIVVADDHTIVREGLVSLLREEPDFFVVGEANNGIQAVELTTALHPEVVVMDINMPGMNGMEATRRIKKIVPSVAIVALSVNDDGNTMAEMLRAGANSYCVKGEASDTLSEAIRSVVRNQGAGA